MKIFGYSVEECLTFFMLVVVGYFIAKLFSQKCNGFSVGAVNCEIQNRGKCKILSNCIWNESESKCTDINAPAPAPAPAGKKDNGSECNSDFDCKSGYCNDSDKCQGCPNDPNYKFNPLNCTKCINDNLQFPDCTECKNNDKLIPPNCTECKGGSKLNPLDCNECKNSDYEPSDCTKCKDKFMNPKDNCRSHIPCEDIKDNVNCTLSNNLHGMCKWVNDKCIRPKKLGDLCEKNNECQTGVCHSKDFIEPYKCMNCSDVNALTCTVYHSDVCDIGKDGKCKYRSCGVRPKGVNNCEINNNNAQLCHASHNSKNELCWYNDATDTCSNTKEGKIFKCK